jgi:hypothetical protein
MDGSVAIAVSQAAVSISRRRAHTMKTIVLVASGNVMGVMRQERSTSSRRNIITDFVRTIVVLT